MSTLNMMVSITNRNTSPKFVEFYKTCNHSVLFSTLARGTANSAVLDYFGLEDTEKVVSFSVVTNDTWKKIKRGLNQEMHIDVPGMGIVFTVPLSSIGGKKVLPFLIQGNEFEKEEETTLKATDYDLLMVIANQGCIDTVMDAARSAGARGGTVIHAKGTGMAGAAKFLGVSLTEEKEIILIVAKTNQKNDIMRAIMEKAGMDSPERAIVFSLPVNSVAGLRLIDNDENEES